MKGLTTPLSRWLRGSCLFVQVLGDLCVISYWIDTLVLKTEGNTYAAVLHHPFLFKGKPMHAQEVASSSEPRPVREGVIMGIHLQRRPCTRVAEL